MERSSVRVILIGGPSGAGKTTLGAALATRLGITSLTVDDLVVAARAVTTPTSHPGLWAMNRVPWPEYFTDSSVEDLKADATRRHEATWPMVKVVIEKYASAPGAAVVIDGWHIRPSYVAELDPDPDNVWAAWIVPAREVLEARERALMLEFYSHSSDPERMLGNFLGRSYWFTDLVEKEATELGMNVLRQPGDATVDDLCDRVLEDLGPRAPRSMISSP
ncbi:MAG: AAA family ATPase [Deinococcales bacterium]